MLLVLNLLIFFQIIFISLAVLGTVLAGRLDNQYLPPLQQYQPPVSSSQYNPPSRQHQSFTQAYQQPSRQYLGPNKQYSAPTRQYLAPTSTRQYSATPQYNNFGSNRQYNTPATGRQYIPPTSYRNYEVPTPSRQYVPQSASSQYNLPSINSQYSALPIQRVTPNNQYQAPQSQRREYLPPTSQYAASNGQYFESGDFSGQYSGNQLANNQVPIVKMDSNPNAGDGVYSYNYETADGISAGEEGNQGRANGGYSYTSPEGEQVSVQYTADESGFHPQGSHLPTSPPIPEEIQRSIEQNLAEEARGDYNQGPSNGPTYDDTVSIENSANGGYKY